jgi:hypothetical protein
VEIDPYIGLGGAFSKRFPSRRCRSASGNASHLTLAAARRASRATSASVNPPFGNPGYFATMASRVARVALHFRSRRLWNDELSRVYNDIVGSISQVKTCVYCSKPVSGTYVERGHYRRHQTCPPQLASCG